MDEAFADGRIAPAASLVRPCWSHPLPIAPTYWHLPAPPPPDVRARLSERGPIITQILFNRGLADPEDVAEFFGLRARPTDPFLMRGVGETVERLRTAIQRHQVVAVYGDFDADGVCSTALLVQTLRAFGADVQPYIPHRVDEGYGLNNEALIGLQQRGVKLVITVDCGIRSVDEVAFGRDLGLDMIVTDHHSVGPELPPALAVINPKQEGCGYPFKGFAGVGVVFKLAQALLQAEEMAPVAAQAVSLHEDDLLDLVALGTVADLMPLRGENRGLVRRGIERLWLGERAGVRALAKVAGAPLLSIDATAIGFRLGPRLNAAGRLDSAMLAYNLLMTADPTEAEALATRLHELNRERQLLTEKAVAWATVELGEAPPDDVILIGREALKPGIVGLVASKLKDIYLRPALVVELGGAEVRGSARSVSEFHITEALDQCADLLVRYGGHAAAAGFTVRHELLPSLRRRLNELAAEKLKAETRVQQVAVDAIVGLRELDFALMGKLRELEPTGAGNAQAILAAPDLMVREARRVGGDGSHLRLRLTDGQMAIDGIAFNQGALAIDLPMRVDVAAHLEENNWQDRRALQLNIRDIQPAGRGIPTERR